MKYEAGTYISELILLNLKKKNNKQIKKRGQKNGICIRKTGIGKYN